MAFKLGKRSLSNLENVHPSLVAVVNQAIEITSQDFMVIEGLRTLEKQKEYYAKGASKTMKSKHLKQPDGFSHAVDVYPFYDGKVHTEAPHAKFKAIADAFAAAAAELGVRITWGGSWKSFQDTPHFQLD